MVYPNKLPVAIVRVIDEAKVDEASSASPDNDNKKVVASAYPQYLIQDTGFGFLEFVDYVPPTPEIRPLAYFSTQFNNNFTVNNVITGPVQLVGNNTISNMIYSDFSITVVDQGTYNIQFIVQCDFSMVLSAPISTLVAYAISINGSLTNALTNPQYNVQGCVINCGIILPLNVGDIIQIFRVAVSNPGTISYGETDPQLTITQLY